MMSQHPLFIAAIGASAGGQHSIKEFFESIPMDVPVGFVIVTHLFRDHKSQLSNIVARYTDLKVHPVNGIMKVEPGNVYVMPEDVLMEIKHGILYLRSRPAQDVINNSIDVFFESLAKDQKERAVGVILSGMGTDGSKGALKLFEYGGSVLVQQPDSTEFNGMPWSAVLKDHPDYILPPKQLGEQLVDMVRAKQKVAI